MQEKKVLWNDRKRIIFGLPWTFTKYKLTFGQRIFKLGTIHCCSADKSTPEFDIKNIKSSEAVKELLSDKVEQERQKKRVSSREYMVTDDDYDDDDIHN